GATRAVVESTSFWTWRGFSVVAEHGWPHPARRLEGHGLVLGFHATGRFRTALTFAAPQFDARVEYLRAKWFTPRLSSPLAVGAARSATLVVPGHVSFLLPDAAPAGHSARRTPP